MAGNKSYSSRAKHVALRLFYVRDTIRKGKITISYVLTEPNVADIGTKFLSKLINYFKA